MSDAYDGLDDLIRPLKRSAIDAYMCSGNWGGIAGFTVEGDIYRYVQPSTGMFGPNVEEVTRPDENGEGGGDWKMRIPLAPDSEEAGKYADEFSGIRSRIDTALHPWTYLPEPGDVAEVVEALRQANRVLALDAVSTNGTVTGGGEIGGNINLAMENSDAMAGGLITAFKADFMSQIGKAVGGNHAITVILGGVLAAEEKIWTGARQTVVDIVKGSTDAFDAAAEGGDVPWDVVLKVVGYAVAGASIFATGGAATGLAVAGLGLTILNDSVPADGDGTSVDAPDGDYDGVMGTFESSLEDLNTAITAEETTLDDNMGDNLKQIGLDQGSYDLTRPPIMDIADDSDLGEIQIDEVLAKEITGTYLPNVAEELGKAATHLNDATSLISILRDSSIGVGQWGPNEHYYDLRYLLYELLKNLQVEVMYSASALHLGIEDIGRADTATNDALEQHAQEVRRYGVGQPGGTYDPWN